MNYSHLFSTSHCFDWSSQSPECSASLMGAMPIHPKALPWWSFFHEPSKWIEQGFPWASLLWAEYVRIKFFRVWNSSNCLGLLLVHFSNSNPVLKRADALWDWPKVLLHDLLEFFPHQWFFLCENKLQNKTSLTACFTSTLFGSHKQHPWLSGRRLWAVAFMMEVYNKTHRNSYTDNFFVIMTVYVVSMLLFLFVVALPHLATRLNCQQGILTRCIMYNATNQHQENWPSELVTGTK